MDKYSNEEILNTTMELRDKQDLFDEFKEHLFTREYINYINILDSFKDIVDNDNLEELLSIIKDTVGIDLRNFHSFDDFNIKTNFKMIIEFLNNFHIDIPKAIRKTFKDNKIMYIDQLENINPIIKNIKSRLKSIIKLMDYDTAENLIYTIYEIYKVDLIFDEG